MVNFGHTMEGSCKTLQQLCKSNNWCVTLLPVGERHKQLKALQERLKCPLIALAMLQPCLPCSFFYHQLQTFETTYPMLKGKG